MRTKNLLTAVAAVSLGIVSVAAAGALRWSALTRELHAALEAARVAPAPSRFDAAELDGLPPPVSRYFRAALRDGAPIVAAATVAHEGEFNLAETGERWRPFSSSQRVVTRRPGFVWDARVRILPGIAVHVHDAYVAGIGVLRPAILGLLPLADLRGDGEIARGELMRYFAEAAWYPTALLPSQGVRWEPLDDRSARATLSDGRVTLAMTFVFGDDGLIESVRADARGRTVGGAIVPTPWEGRWTRYAERNGMSIPTEGEVAWLLPSGRHTYWRGTIVSLSYEFAR